MVYFGEVFSTKNLDGFSFEETKKNVNQYFVSLERLRWEWAKLNAQKGLTAKYDFSAEYKKEPYTPLGKDVFQLSAKELKEEQLKAYISSYYWAMSILAENEKRYIEERFIKHKFEDEFVDLLGFESSDSNEFRTLKKSAIYKFADFLGLVVERS